MIKICKNERMFGLFVRLVYRASTKEQFFEKLSKKQYLEILGINDKDKLNFRGKDLHRAYLNQIKKYHSDKVHTDEAKRQFDEITKCITKAYQQLKNQQDGIFYSKKSNAQTNQEQDQVARDLFGKSYVDIKHSLYASGNQQMRIKFVQQLMKRKKVNSNQTTSRAYQQPSTRGTGFSQSNYQPQSGGSSTAIATMLGVICLALVPFLFMQSKKKAVLEQSEDSDPNKHKVREYSEQEYDIIHENTKKLAIKPYQRFCNLILKRRPHMLNYPSNFDFDIFQQLLNHSIAPDIHLFQVDAKYFVNKEENKKLLEANSVEGIEKYELTETKPNTLMTLSLEAERMLQNIYVPVDDVLAEIKETGKFIPPKVLFRFYGFIMFQIRDKPFSNLIGYRNTRYISLFDLYFDYYSPIFFKRNYFAQYLVGFQKDEALKHSRYFGNVNLNHREVPSRYLEKGQKIVVMKDVQKAYENSGILKPFESKYAQDWQNYYAKFEKNWKKYCAHQVNS